MFCPQCGSNQGDELKFCKSCGAKLQTVRQALTGREPGEKFDWNKTWIADLLLSEEEQQIRAEERERQLGITPEVKRYKEIKAGVITCSIGIGVMVFLKIFMEGLILSGNIPPNAVDIIGRVWAAGLIPFFIGVGLMINGVFIGKKLVESIKKESAASTGALEGKPGYQSLRAPNTSEFMPPDFSVTEGTTKQLRKPGQNQ